MGQNLPGVSFIATGSSANVVVTGLGFTPRRVILRCDEAGQNVYSLGTADRDHAPLQRCVVVGVVGGDWTSNQVLDMIGSAGDPTDINIQLSAWGADGFTLTPTAGPLGDIVLQWCAWE